MTRSAVEPSGFRSMAETHPEGVQFFTPEERKTGRACLLQIYPAGVDAEMIRLKKNRTLIGRDLSCDIALEDTAVSRTHAAIDFDDSSYFAADLGSRNGTFVDDQPLRDRRRLAGGELIRLGGTILKFMASMDEEAQYHAVVHELMTRDPLTNAFNRSVLMSSLEKLLQRCRRSGHDLSVIVIDIDYFKNVNDTCGHLVGDEVLRIFCERLRGTLRPNDILCRLGGEEFVIVAEGTPVHEAVRIAERLRLAVSAPPFQTQAGIVNVTCSLGVAQFDPVATATVDQLLSAADGRLYAAKKAGRNCVKSAFDQDTLKY